MDKKEKKKKLPCNWPRKKKPRQLSSRGPSPFQSLWEERHELSAALVVSFRIGKCRGRTGKGALFSN